MYTDLGTDRCRLQAGRIAQENSHTTRHEISARDTPHFVHLSVRQLQGGKSRERARRNCSQTPVHVFPLIYFYPWTVRPGLANLVFEYLIPNSGLSVFYPGFFRRLTGVYRVLFSIGTHFSSLRLEHTPLSRPAAHFRVPSKRQLQGRNALSELVCFWHLRFKHFTALHQITNATF